MALAGAGRKERSDDQTDVLIKQALRSALELGDARFRPICEQTAFILFLATPRWVSALTQRLRPVIDKATQRFGHATVDVEPLRSKLLHVLDNV